MTTILPPTDHPDSTTFPSVSITDPFLVIDDFLPVDLAQAMRDDIDRHASEPYTHRPDTHQIWNYWFVRGQYTYLRTQPEKVIRGDRLESFAHKLISWSGEVLGLRKVTWPFLSLYVSGCGQGLHNDSKNGRFAYVYSLTRTERRTIGGETIVMREGDLFRRHLRTASAGFRELIEPCFNRLVVFDDRLIHGVERVDGSMDPKDARWVLQGHIEEGGPIVAGALTLDAVRDPICAMVDSFLGESLAMIELYQGPLVLRFTISPQGQVSQMRVVLDRVMREHDGDVEWLPLKARLLGNLSSATFPSARSETSVTLPVMFGGAVATPHP